MDGTSKRAAQRTESAGEVPRIRAAIETHYAEKKRLRRSLSDGGRIYLERRLPFLAVHRHPVEALDPGTEQLVTSQAAFLITRVSPRRRHPYAGIVKAVAEQCQPAFGAFLIVDIWSRPEAHPPVVEPSIPPVPAFRLFGGERNGRGAEVLDVLDRHLGKIVIGGRKAVTEQIRNPREFPDRPRPFLTAAEARSLRCVQIGIEVEPVYRQASGEIYPSLLKRLRRQIGYTLQHGFFYFAEQQTDLRPKNFHSLGRRALVKSVWSADRTLDDISSSFDFLMEINPVNVASVWNRFRKSGFEKLPPFRYRPLSVDPSLVKRALFAIPLERVEDPTISHLFYQKQAELDRKLTMLSDRDTPRFLHGSLQLYGKISNSLLRAADTILEKIPAYLREKEHGRKVSPEVLAARAGEELEGYRREFPDAVATIEFRQNLIAGLMVSKGRLLISNNAKVSREAAEALIQHEVGTHLVTYFNGGAQRFAQLRSGLAGYEQLQEGLAVLAEYLVGGLTPGRMRVVAARVAAARAIIEGASFIDCFRMLSRYGFTRRTAFNITVRIYRGGGLTKDCIYLRGLNDVLKYLRDNGSLELLFVGKIATEQIPIVSELLSRGVIAPPRLMPRYLKRESCRERLADLRRGIAVHDLLEIEAE